MVRGRSTCTCTYDAASPRGIHQLCSLRSALLSRAGDQLRSGRADSKGYSLGGMEGDKVRYGIENGTRYRQEKFGICLIGWLVTGCSGMVRFWVSPVSPVFFALHPETERSFDPPLSVFRLLYQCKTRPVCLCLPGC